MNNIYHPTLHAHRASEAPPRRARTDGDDLHNDGAPSPEIGGARRLHRHRQTVSHGSSDPYRSRKHHLHTRSHGHHHIADGLRSTMGEQMQQIALENEKRERRGRQRPNMTREDAAARLGQTNGTGTGQEGQVRRQIVIREVDVARERSRQRIRDDELLDTLHRITDHSLSTTRRLDDTFYSILERVSGLRTIINSLQELSIRTKSLCHDFESESKHISRDITSQTSQFHNFDHQRSKIAELETRIKRGQERSAQVSQKLEKCRERLAWVEKRDAEEVKRNTRFYRGMWSTLGVIAGFLLLLFLIHHLRNPSHHMPGSDDAAGKLEQVFNKSTGRLPPQVQGMLEELRRDRETQSKQVGEDLHRTGEDEKVTSRLRVFDEL